MVYNYSFVIPRLLAGCSAPYTIQDADDIIATAAFRTIVDLRAEADYPDAVRSRFEANGIRLVKIPVEDFEPPTQSQMELMCSLLLHDHVIPLMLLDDANTAHQHVVLPPEASDPSCDDLSSLRCGGGGGVGALLIHCRQGIGRTGTMLAAAVAFLLSDHSLASLRHNKSTLVHESWWQHFTQGLARSVNEAWSAELRRVGGVPPSANWHGNSHVVAFVRRRRQGYAMEVPEQVAAAVSFEKSLGSSKWQTRVRGLEGSPVCFAPSDMGGLEGATLVPPQQSKKTKASSSCVCL
jgi:hypothetical protein